MNELLFGVISIEMGLILLLLFKTPVRKFEILCIDRVKRGRGPLVVKSVSATILVIMIYTVHCVTDLYSRPDESRSPTDQLILSHQLLQASLMGFALFLSFMIDRLHHYMRELRLLRKATEAAKKQNRSSDDIRSGSVEEIKALEEELAKLRRKVKKLESDSQTKQREAESAVATSESLRGQSGSLLLQYDRLLEENQHLNSQLQSLNQNSSHTAAKKNT